MDRQRVNKKEIELIKELAEYITFYEKPKKHIYDFPPKKADFATLQIEGVAMLLNRLDKFNIALLADEVGMGKTFQALTVISEQFRKKDDSKVLIITPRKEILNQWKQEEYNEFRNKHLFEKFLPENNDEHIIEIKNFEKGFLNENPNAKIVFAKSTSFSTSENSKNNERKKKLLRDIEKFDLIVVDEAHKFRNYDEISDNANATYIIQTAKMLFSNIKEDTKILLMTATPLHSRIGDFKRIVNLFNIKNQNFLEIKDNEKELMKNIMVRRLRVMSNGANKYEYRNEIATPVLLTDKEDLKNELFFAMLQKEYAKSDNEKNLSKGKYLLDFLEGTTFDENFEKENEEISSDNKELKKILKIYEEIYGKNEKPTNNKYKIVLENILKKDEKALVFVRRTASAYELTRQYINEFDKKAWNLINKTINKVTNSNITIKMPNSRDEFEQIIKKYLKENNLDEKIETIIHHPLWEIENNKDIVKKFKKKSENIPNGQKSIRTKTARKLIIMEYFEENEEFNEDKFIDFLKNLNLEDNIDIQENDKVPKSVILDLFKTKKGNPSTHASRFLQKFSKSSSPYSKFFEKDFVKIYTHKNFKDDKYDIKKLVKSAVLHASVGLIELYCCDIEAGKNKTKNQYQTFLKIVEKKAKNNELSFIKKIDMFLDNFDAYKKYLKFNENQFEENNESKKNEAIFYDSQPAYPYVGNTKNKTVITRFNSPFFPDLLCGTSTLQEGVNLHLFCNKVYHFGAAYTMGDDEQRIGRVDRLMGKMDRELSEYKEGKPYPTLDIHYPYLKSTFDEFNLKKLLCNKRKTEKLIDRGIDVVKENNLLCDKSIDELLHKIKIK
jgi:superfamily II DNA or RNA helicase